MVNCPITDRDSNSLTMKTSTLFAFTSILFFLGLEMADCETRWVRDDDGQEREQEWYPPGGHVEGWVETGRTRGERATKSQPEEADPKSTPSVASTPSPILSPETSAFFEGGTTEFDKSGLVGLSNESTRAAVESAL